ncbi:MAG: STY0301 family protein [Pseudomonadota bacterium]
MRIVPVLLLSCLASPLAAQGISCPPMLAPTPAGFTLVPRPSPTGFPFRGAEQTGPRRFDRISVVDGPESDVMAEAPGTLMPDEGASGRPRPPSLRQRWNLAGGSPRGHLLVCHYAGTAAVLTRVLPPRTRECRQSLPVNARGEISENGPRSGSCR